MIGPRTHYAVTTRGQERGVSNACTLCARACNAFDWHYATVCVCVHMQGPVLHLGTKCEQCDRPQREPSR
eukprot:282866-Alexandrium_andersonii.AAC.1